jgi:hypothetical protein
MRSFVHALAVVLLVATPALAQNVWDKQPAYGGRMMSKAEKKLYWREFLAFETDEERQVYWDDHVAKMTKRALEWGVSPPRQRKVLSKGERFLGYWRRPYFPDMMTEEEAANYRSDLDAIPDRDDRRRYVADHIRRMQARAESRGVSVPSAAEFDDVFDPPESADATETAAAEDEDDESNENDDFDAFESGEDDSR